MLYLSFMLGLCRLFSIFGRIPNIEIIRPDIRQFHLLFLTTKIPLKKHNWIKRRVRRRWFLRIFTVAFLLFLAPVWGSSPAGPIFNPAGHSLTLTSPNLT